ncbi:E3 SUMO-protein ligase PIAS1 [Sarcoptes scabiei]|uniref:E3 SUMO-protein ligase PIAS1 n=1 Tax=Sarcoptes scabiei TaxID=52283 RepID=A0A834R0N5_SARSC|nr:E3 SUMO-protein ligase PIAS1 [Sarcoptes scabiei]
MPRSSRLTSNYSADNNSKYCKSTSPSEQSTPCSSSSMIPNKFTISNQQNVRFNKNSHSQPAYNSRLLRSAQYSNLNSLPETLNQCLPINSVGNNQQFGYDYCDFHDYITTMHYPSNSSISMSANNNPIQNSSNNQKTNPVLFSMPRLSDLSRPDTVPSKLTSTQTNLVKFAKLNSYQELACLVKPTSLKPYGIGLTSTFKLSRCNFDSQIEKIFIRFCKYSSQLTEQTDCLPKSFVLTINNCSYTVKNKYTLTPYDITPRVIADVYSGINILIASNDSSEQTRDFYYGVYYARKIDHRILIENIKQKGPKAISITMEMIKKKLQNDEDIIADNFVKASLLCPLSTLRIKIPARSIKCEHINCFDLESFIKINDITPRWRCPICKIYVDCDEIIIDGFLMKILSESPSDATESHVFCDETYKIYKDGVLMSLPHVSGERRPLSDAKELKIPKKRKIEENDPIVSSKEKIECITISDSEDGLDDPGACNSDDTSSDDTIISQNNYSDYEATGDNESFNIENSIKAEQLDTSNLKTYSKSERKSKTSEKNSKNKIKGEKNEERKSFGSLSITNEESNRTTNDAHSNNSQDDNDDEIQIIYEKIRSNQKNQSSNSDNKSYSKSDFSNQSNDPQIPLNSHYQDQLDRITDPNTEYTSNIRNRSNSNLQSYHCQTNCSNNPISIQSKENSSLKMKIICHCRRLHCKICTLKATWNPNVSATGSNSNCVDFQRYPNILHQNTSGRFPNTGPSSLSNATVKTTTSSSSSKGINQAARPIVQCYPAMPINDSTVDETFPPSTYSNALLNSNFSKTIPNGFNHSIQSQSSTAIDNDQNSNTINAVNLSRNRPSDHENYYSNCQSYYPNTNSNGRENSMNLDGSNSSNSFHRQPSSSPSLTIHHVPYNTNVQSVITINQQSSTASSQSNPILSNLSDPSAILPERNSTPLTQYEDNVWKQNPTIPSVYNADYNQSVCYPNNSSQFYLHSQQSVVTNDNQTQLWYTK